LAKSLADLPESVIRRACDCLDVFRNTLRNFVLHRVHVKPLNSHDSSAVITGKPVLVTPRIKKQAENAYAFSAALMVYGAGSIKNSGTQLFGKPFAFVAHVPTSSPQVPLPLRHQRNAAPVRPDSRESFRVVFPIADGQAPFSGADSSGFAGLRFPMCFRTASLTTLDMLFRDANASPRMASYRSTSMLTIIFRLLAIFVVKSVPPFD
jgi:hypothetical protein